MRGRTQPFWEGTPSFWAKLVALNFVGPMQLTKALLPRMMERGAGKIWERMIASMLEGAELQPLIVINGTPNAMVEPNHLTAQGFYLLRARTQLEELTDILQK